MRNALVEMMIELAERGRVPDGLIRTGMRGVVAARLRREVRENPGTCAVAGRLAEGPLVVAAPDANAQHYDVPAGFFEVMLGPRLKYSCCSWSRATDLATAEEEMLRLTAARADVADGHRILDLGCGWGSFSLWAADVHPTSQVVAVSNSSTQRRYIEARAERSGLDNISVVTTDVAHFAAEGSFDRIVSIEMLEHVRNHRLLFERAASWLRPGGLMFVHVFAHAEHAYPYDVRGAADWMAANFFTGGIMPSRRLLPVQAQGAFSVARQWTVSGTHYQRTLDAWLRNLDRGRDEAIEALHAAGGRDPGIELQRWRMFLMACSELFGFRDGSEWAVEHYLFRPG